MAFMRSSVPMLPLLLAILLAASTSFRAYADGCNFAATCANEYLSGTILTASCAAINGDSVTSSLDLNSKISNENGILAYPGADFGASCYNIGLNGGHTLDANCKDDSGALIETSLDLNQCISNDNGYIEFC